MRPLARDHDAPRVLLGALERAARGGDVASGVISDRAMGSEWGVAHGGAIESSSASA